MTPADDFDNVEQFDAGLGQLRHALKHFERGEYASTLTLAGAAEHILAGVVKERHGSERKTALEVFKERLNTPPPWLRDPNGLRNWLKHPPTKDIGAVYPARVFVESTYMLSRAYFNLMMCDLELLPEVEASLFKVHDIWLWECKRMGFTADVRWSKQDEP